MAKTRLGAIWEANENARIKKVIQYSILIQFMKFNTNIILVTTAVSRFHCYCCWCCCCCTTIRMPTTSMDILVHHTHNNRWAVQFQANCIGKTRPNETEREKERERGSEGLMAVGKRIKNRRNEKLIDSAWHSKLDCCDITTIRAEWDVTAAAAAYRCLDPVECEPMLLWVVFFYWLRKRSRRNDSRSLRAAGMHTLSTKVSNVRFVWRILKIIV